VRRMPKVTYLWPGLPQLWTWGDWYALGIAVAASIALNVALLTSFGWRELVAPPVRIALWTGLAIAWATAAAATELWNRRRDAPQNLVRSQDCFAEAVQCYLKEDYYRAECLLKDLLGRDHRDVDARLMLATLMRRTGRFREAGDQLDLLARIDGAEKWDLEIRRERNVLRERSENVRTIH